MQLKIKELYDFLMDTNDRFQIQKKKKRLKLCELYNIIIELCNY